MFKEQIENWSALEEAVQVHERAPLVGSLFVKILVDAGFSNADIRLAATTMIAYID